MAAGTRNADQAAGPDVGQAATALGRITQRLRRTWPETDGIGSVVLDFGKYANVIDIGRGQGLALCADGVGSKALIAQMLGKYDTIGIDCVAMNVNDLVCVGAKPVSLVDYIAVERIDPDVLDQIAEGLATGASQAGVSISGGEIAELPDMITGWKPGLGFDLAAMATGILPLDSVAVGRNVAPGDAVLGDLAAMATGILPLDSVAVGRNVAPGDAVLGIGASGIHSNGLTLARKVFFDDLGLDAASHIDEFGRSLGEELLEPTLIYVTESLSMVGQWLAKAVVHVTGDGLLNLTRVDAPVGFVLDALPPVPPVFRALAGRGGVPAADLYGIYNMGVGLIVITDPTNAAIAMAFARNEGKTSQRIGTVTAEAGTIRITANEFTKVDLVSDGKAFRPA